MGTDTLPSTALASPCVLPSPSGREISTISRILESIGVPATVIPGRMGPIPGAV